MSSMKKIIVKCVKTSFIWSNSEILLGVETLRVVVGVR